MTLYTLVNILKQIALSQPNVRSASDGSIYEKMNATNSVKYDVVHFSQTKHIEDEETDTYGFNIFYVSRLEDSLEDNRLQIQSIGKEVLGNILRTFCENWSIDFPEIIYYPYTQKFTDLCAGVYCRVEIEVPKEIICADDYIDEITPSKGIKLENITVEIDQNGTREVTPSPGFDGIGKVTIVTDVSGGSCNLEYKEVEYTEPGEYTVVPSSGYDGLSEVAVSVNVDCYPSYQAGYEVGYQRGEWDQKEKLVITGINQNGTYEREDGYRAVVVDVPTAQVIIEDNKLVTESAMTYEGGYYYTNLQIYPDEGYDVMRTVDLLAFTEATEAIADGENRQKAKLSSTSFTQNSAYTNADGWSSVTINVPDRYDEGYADGFAAGASACSGLFITAITLNVDSAITDSATATTTFSPLTSITDIYYTSSDPTIATIDSGTGVITVIMDGTVTICAIDRITHLQDCKQVIVSRSDYHNTYLTFHCLSSGKIKWNTNSTNFKKTIEYSKDSGSTWVEMIPTDSGSTQTGIVVQAGDIVWVRGDNETYCNPLDTEKRCWFEASVTCNVYGNIMSLIDSTGFATATTITSPYAFKSLFRFSHILSAKNLVLPATTLSEGCYQYMFNGCSSLTAVPRLPATTMANNCYAYMFYGCSSLTAAPELPSTSLAVACYKHMFDSCTSLVTPPVLSATTLAEQCYANMFYSCSTLVTAPELPATSLVSECYYQMFNACFRLNHIKCLATNITANNCILRWVEYVPSGGTFVKNPNMSSWPTGDSGIPSGWTIIDNS